MRFAWAKERGEQTIVGIPFEFRSSGRPGSSLAPARIREASYVIEPYSPQLEKSLEEVAFVDIGDVYVEGCPKRTVEEIKEAVSGLKNPIVLGGDHTITIGSAEAVDPDVVLYIDAHLDLRDEYMGSQYSHACVARRLMEMGYDVVFLGVRSGSREEWRTAKNVYTENWPTHWSEDVYITIDLDVFDPAYVPTPVPEPGGVTPKEFFSWLYKLDANVLGVDIVEYNPLLDVDGRGAVLAAKIVREILLLRAGG